MLNDAGKIVYKDRGHAAEKENQFLFDGNVDLPSGMYYVNIITPEGTATEKVIKY